MKKIIPSVLFVMAATVPPLAAQQAPLVVNFEDGVGKFTGPILPIATDAQEGKACAKIQADFSAVADQPWKTAKLALPGFAKNKIQRVSFWIKSTDVRQLTVRIQDATKQTFQLRPKFNPDGQWQQIVIETFEKGPGFQSFGGAGDKVIHWPATHFYFILEKNGLVDATKGSVLIDQLTIEPGDAL